MTSPHTVQGERLPFAPTLPREQWLITTRAWIRLARTQRRLARENDREAAKWEREGDRRRFAECMLEARRLRRDAKRTMVLARCDYEGAWQ